MNESDRPKFQTALNGLWATLSPGKTFEIGAQRAYFEALEDMPIDRVLSALSRCLRECRFFPKPVEIREKSVQSTMTAEDAWAIVNKAIDDIGYTRSPDLPERIAVCVQRCGGWQYLCGMPESEFHAFAFARFRDNWKSLEKLDDRRITQEFRPLIGWHEQNNHRTNGAKRIEHLL